MITKKDLKTAPKHAFLYCEQCECTFSATYDDYFEMLDTDIFTCSEGCEEVEEDFSEESNCVPFPLVLAVRQGPKVIKR